MEKNRIIVAALVGAILGIVSEFAIRPLIEKPIENKVEELVK